MHDYFLAASLPICMCFIISIFAFRASMVIRRSSMWVSAADIRTVKNEAFMDDFAKIYAIARVSDMGCYPHAIVACRSLLLRRLPPKEKPQYPTDYKEGLECGILNGGALGEKTHARQATIAW